MGSPCCRPAETHAEGIALLAERDATVRVGSLLRPDLHAQRLGVAGTPGLQRVLELGQVSLEAIGRVQAGANQLFVPEAGGAYLHGGNHHFGTTRMSDSPARGVVDRDCRVHGMDNLYVAGSSVFPTTGYANSTLTIVALSARLAALLARPEPAVAVRRRAERRERAPG